jgi:hypothetical protein
MKYPYTEEQIMIRSMPCPTCFAKPRHHCKRKPREDGGIKNHQERQWLWHDFVKSCKKTGLVQLHKGTIEWAVNAEQSFINQHEREYNALKNIRYTQQELHDEYERQQESMRTGK